MKVCSGAGVNLGMAIPHNQDGEGRTSAISDGEDFESMSRRAILNKIAVAGLLLAGLSWQEEAHAEVGAVSWPIAASGRVDYKQRIAIEKVPESSPIQTLLPDNGVAVITGSNTGEEGVRANVRALVEGDPKLAASLLRLAFHDATARDTESGEGGANGSILYELERRENYGLGLAIKALQPIKLTCGLGWADTIAVYETENHKCSPYV